jgi:hypothetical protein
VSETFVGEGYTIEWLGITERPVPTSDTPPANPSDSITNGPAARVTIEKSGEVTTLFWPRAWGADDGFQNVMYMANAYARKQIECLGL